MVTLQTTGQNEDEETFLMLEYQHCQYLKPKGELPSEVFLPALEKLGRARHWTQAQLGNGFGRAMEVLGRGAQSMGEWLEANSYESGDLNRMARQDFARAPLPVLTPHCISRPTHSFAFSFCIVLSGFGQVTHHLYATLAYV